MTLPSGGYEEVIVVGTEPGNRLGTAWNLVEGDAHSVLQSDAIFIDRTELARLEYPEVGEVREIAGRRARVAGMTQGIKGFLVFPYVFTTYDRAAAYLKKRPEACSYFLVQLEDGADAKQVCAAIRERIPEMDAFPREEYSRISIRYWMTRTGLGISFGAATLLGLLVGMVMVAQTLYTLVLDRLTEFGALKAMGATDRQIFFVLLVQGTATALVGAFLGLIVTFTIQRAFSTPHAPIVIPWQLALGSCALVLCICAAASLLPCLRIRKLDPMMVLQG
jgi:putative ABC transport system permease protein